MGEQRRLVEAEMDKLLKDCYVVLSDYTLQAAAGYVEAHREYDQRVNRLCLELNTQAATWNSIVRDVQVVMRPRLAPVVVSPRRHESSEDIHITIDPSLLGRCSRV